jgi:hypothetical protein
MMAKQFAVTKEEYPYPSRFGSHASMVVKDNEDGTVVCADEFGEYTTSKSRLDDRQADSLRYTEKRLKKLLTGNKKEN